MLTAGYPKALIPFHVPNNITCCVSLPFPSTSKFFYINMAGLHYTQVGLYSFYHRLKVSLQIGDESPDMYMFSLIPPSYIYVSKCMYVYVHISLFLPKCACTTIIDISPRIFRLISEIYCCCVSIIIVICIVVVYQS